MPRPGNTDERREQIVAALAAEMAERGYDGATVARVARRAGLTPGLVHYHFHSKLEILEALQRGLVEEHDARLDAAVEAAGPSARARIDAFLDAHLATGDRADPDAMACWVMLAGEALRHDEVRRGYRAALEGAAARLEGLITAGVEGGELDCDAPRAAATALLATIEGYYVVAATARELIPHGSAAGAAKRMADGLLAPPAEGAS